MDAVIFICICLFFVIRQMNEGESNETALDHIQKEDVTRTAKLNDNFYEDENAFMDIAHALGFPTGNQS